MGGWFLAFEDKDFYYYECAMCNKNTHNYKVDKKTGVTYVNK